MSMHLIVISNKQIKPVIFRYTGRTAATAAPFAKSSRSISSPFKHTTYRLFVAPQWGATAINANGRVAGVFPG